MPIGRFAQLCRLSVKQLRHYDAIGLLPPASVAADSGYRLYRTQQVRAAQVIALLRAVDVPLEEVAEVVRGGDGAAEGVLARHRERLLGRLDAAGRMLATVERLLERGAIMPYDITVEELEREPVLRVQLTTTMAELGQTTGAALQEVAKELAGQGVAPAGPSFLTCPLPDEGGQVDIEAGWPVAEPVVASGRATPGELPAGRAAVTVHVGPYEGVEPAFEAMTEWLRAHGETPVAAPSERFLNDPTTTAPADLRTRITWPLA
jgi:DNA-binding transcriptional MerR regulator